jgi:hypothetical protein
VKLVAVLLCLPILGQAADEGKPVIDDAIAALGGPNFLALHNRVESGRAYSFYRERLSGLSIATIYTEYLDPAPAKSLAIRQRQAFGKKQDYSILFLEDQGYEITFRGARPLPDERWKRYATGVETNILYILRTQHDNKSFSYDFVRSDVMSNTHVNIVDVTDPENRTVRVYFDYNTKLPIRQEYSEWDPVGRQKATDVTTYSKYRAAGGLQLPYVTQREHNGEVEYQIFADDVQANSKLPEKTFELPSGIKVLAKPN